MPIITTHKSCLIDCRDAPVGRLYDYNNQPGRPRHPSGASLQLQCSTGQAWAAHWGVSTAERSTGQAWAAQWGVSTAEQSTGRSGHSIGASLQLQYSTGQAWAPQVIEQFLRPIRVIFFASNAIFSAPPIIFQKKSVMRTSLLFVLNNTIYWGEC